MVDFCPHRRGSNDFYVNAKKMQHFCSSQYRRNILLSTAVGQTRRIRERTLYPVHKLVWFHYPIFLFHLKLRPPMERIPRENQLIPRTTMTLYPAISQGDRPQHQRPISPLLRHALSLLLRSSKIPAALATSSSIAPPPNLGNDSDTIGVCLFCSAFARCDTVP
jgi:hypothetical protein